MGDLQVNKTCDKAIVALSEGDKDALSDIFDCMARMIFSVAYGITGNYQDAENVLQETMIEISKYAHKYRRGSNAKAWILTMARHCSIDIVRKRKPIVSIEETMNMPDSKPDFTWIEVLDMLKTLDEEEKQCVIFRLYSKMPYKEIAEMMKVSVPLIYDRKERIKGRLEGIKECLID